MIDSTITRTDNLIMKVLKNKYTHAKGSSPVHFEAIPFFISVYRIIAYYKQFVEQLHLRYHPKQMMWPSW